VLELAGSRWSKVRSNPNFFNAEGFPGCSAAGPGSPAQPRTTSCSALFAPKILQVFPSADLTIPLFYQVG